MLCFTLYLRAISKYKPRGAYIWRGDLTNGFLRYKFGDLYLKVLIQGGAYFRNFTVSFMNPFTFPFIHQDDELIKISKDGFFHWYLIHQIFTYLDRVTHTKKSNIWGERIYFQFFYSPSILYRLIKCPFAEKLASQNSLQNKDSENTIKSCSNRRRKSKGKKRAGEEDRYRFDIGS